MSWRRIADYLVKRGYRRCLCDLEPSFAKITSEQRDVEGVTLATETGVEHVISACDLMDAVALGRWDTIAYLTRLSPVEVLGFMAPEETTDARSE